MAKMAKMMGFSRGVDVMRVSSAGRAIDGRRTERHGGCTGLRSFVRGRVLERGATATAFASTSPAVLLTREESKNDKLRALLEGRGYETFELPLVEHTRNEGGRADLVHELAGGEGRVDWFITTSPEAAVVFTECWQEAGSPRWPRVASIGKGTTRALEENGAGGLIGFTPSKATGKVLARELPFSDGGAPIVVYPSSELASGDVEAGLGSRGFRVRRINTYGTRPVESLTEAQVQAASAAEVVTFGSPSAIRAWKHLTGRTDVYSCCIGGTSHEACLKNGFEEAKVYSPSKPGLEGWTDVVTEVMDLLATEEGRG